MSGLFRLLLICLHSLVLLHVAAAAEQPSNSFVQRFKSLEWPSPSSQTGKSIHRYRLYVPENLASNPRWPLLVWLHGDGYPGDKRINLNWLPLVFNASDDSPPLFILAPQRAGEEWFVYTTQQVEDELSSVIQLIDYVKAKYPIDPDRIYLSGVSAGATACWELASRDPKRFAAMAPLASSGGDFSCAAKLTAIPIWVFHAKFDSWTSGEGDKAMVKAIQHAGGIAELTETEPKVGVGSSHNCWTAAFEDYKLLDWLLAQHRGEPIPPYTGRSFWRWLGTFIGVSLIWLKTIAWVALPWMAVVLCLWIVWRTDQQRRIADRDVTIFDRK